MKTFEDFQVNQELEPLRIGPITHMDLVRYAGASGDFNPIHTDPEFAKKVGLNGTIAHGMFVMAQLGRLLTNHFHLHKIKSFGVKFRGMTKLGETLICTGVVKKKNEEQRTMIVSLQAASESGDIKASGEAEIQF
ncbi:MAG: MaoC/PaaZ C-terminal domain-containing protein [Leptospiraceae bacterium]|nr:MaoC/PaaZ C-terminal domain-containing protein [Leptospiraceae bacterium]MDW7975100.1 MaoC/PaaZ C-terminal domain-containing protein [Leptospiraceae bacterium]